MTPWKVIDRAPLPKGGELQLAQREQAAVALARPAAHLGQALGVGGAARVEHVAEAAQAIGAPLTIDDLRRLTNEMIDTMLGYIADSADEEIIDALLLKFDALLGKGDTDSAAKVVAKIPDGPIADKWTNYKFERKLVNPANRRKYDIIVIGTGLAGGSAAATLAELGVGSDDIAEAARIVETTREAVLGRSPD